MAWSSIGMLSQYVWFTLSISVCWVGLIYRALSWMLPGSPTLDSTNVVVTPETSGRVFANKLYETAIKRSYATWYAHRTALPSELYDCKAVPEATASAADPPSRCDSASSTSLVGIPSLEYMEPASLEQILPLLNPHCRRYKASTWQRAPVAGSACSCPACTCLVLNPQFFWILNIAHLYIPSSVSFLCYSYPRATSVFCYGFSNYDIDASV